jgi:hypothetical protein
MLELLATSKWLGLPPVVCVLVIIAIVIGAIWIFRSIR